MSDDETQSTQPTRPSEGRVSRSQLLKAVGGGIALSVIPGKAAAAGAPQTMTFPFYPHLAGTYSPEYVADILNALVTMERWVLANLTATVNATPPANLHPLHLPIEQASVVEALSHVELLESLGAVALATTYTAGGQPTLGLDQLRRKETVTSILVGAYITAAREFAEQGQPWLVKIAVQTAGEHAEHRALARTLQALEGAPAAIPPANKAFETDLFVRVADAYALMESRGQFGRLPVSLPYPTRDQALAAGGPMAAAVIQRRPNDAVVSVTAADFTTLAGERP